MGKDKNKSFREIKQKALANIFKDLKRLDSSDTRFCFLIGAGASKSSGIPTGWELADTWYKYLKEIFDDDELSKWEKDIDFDIDKIGEFYPQI